MMISLSNWGRWGKEDQIGALNLIIPKKKKQAVALVKKGISVSLAHNVIKEPAEDSSPFLHEMIQTGLNTDSPASNDVFSVQ